MATKNINIKCKKESPKLPLKNVTQTIKKLFHTEKKQERYRFIYWILKGNKYETSSMDMLEY